MKPSSRYSEESASRGKTALQLAGVRDLKTAVPGGGSYLKRGGRSAGGKNRGRNEVVLGPCEDRSAPLEVDFCSVLNRIFSSQKGTLFMLVVVWVPASFKIILLIWPAQDILEFRSRSF